jgi:hypothetical protein
MSAMRVALVTLTLLAACADDDATYDRGPIGKADAVGSCAGTECDGQAPDGNCFCDAECAEFGDCCGDFVEVCEAGSAPCGGLAGLTCTEGSYCHFEQEQRCGAADQLGTCVELPQACIEVFAPVCGCDGVTYDNSCFAAGAGVSVASDGACDGEPAGTSCGGLAGLSCGSGEFCDFDADQMCGAADQLGTCTPTPDICATVIDPVCGCDGQTHNNACEANRAGVAVSSSGACL